jgi:RHS repeat-associated protein
MLTTVNGTTTLTTSIGSIEEVQTTGSTTTTTTYYAVGGQRVAAKFYYFGYDALGSQVAVFHTSGNLIGSQLYGPYGNPRYSAGTVPTSIGFTGQQTDSVTGLDYYGARYYDPVAGVFLSADTVQGDAQGMNPYAYVSGNPETHVDPSGHMDTPDEELGGGGGGSGAEGSGGDGGGDGVGANDDVETTQDDPNNIDEPTQAERDQDEASAQTVQDEDNFLHEEQQEEQRANQKRADQQEEQTDSTVNTTEHPSDPTEHDNTGADVNTTEHPSDPTEHDNTDAETKGPYFRGTSPGYSGSPSAQRLGVTPASTSPAVGTAFATQNETMYGQGVLYIASSEDLEGVEITEGNVLAGLEDEVGIWITPTEFAERASISIGASDARAILSDMGISVPATMNLSNLNSVLSELPSMSIEQIDQFVQAALRR